MTMNKHFASNLLSQGSIEHGSIEQCKKIQFLVYLMKISISVLNFSSESAKRPTIYDLLFLIAISTPKSNNKHPSEMRNQHHSSHFNRSFSRFGTNFDDRPKMLTYCQIFPNVFLLKNCPMKIKVSQAQDNWLVFKEAPAYKRGKRRSVHPLYKQS